MVLCINVPLHLPPYMQYQGDWATWKSEHFPRFSQNHFGRNLHFRAYNICYIFLAFQWWEIQITNSHLNPKNVIWIRGTLPVTPFAVVQIYFRVWPSSVLISVFLAWVSLNKSFFRERHMVWPSKLSSERKVESRELRPGCGTVNKTLRYILLGIIRQWAGALPAAKAAVGTREKWKSMRLLVRAGVIDIFWATLGHNARETRFYIPWTHTFVVSFQEESILNSCNTNLTNRAWLSKCCKDDLII